MKNYIRFVPIYIFLIFLLATFNSARSQNNDSLNVSPWSFNGFSGLTVSQNSFSNWAKGGVDNYAVSGLLNLSLNYQNSDSSVIWTNSLETGYGIIKSDEFGIRKSDDKIILDSKFGHIAFSDFYYSALINFSTQFDKGYNYPNDSVKVSGFMAPAFLIVSAGLDYKPVEWLSIYFSPISGRFIFVNDQRLADSGAYGVNPAVYDTTGAKIKDGEKFKAAFGAYLTATFEKEIVENITLKSKLDLFNNYTNKNAGDRGNIVVNWENSFIMKVNSLISANLFLHFIYDHDQKIPTYSTVSGEQVQTGSAPRLQIKEILGIGFSVKF